MRQFVNLTCLEVVDLTQSYKFVIESDDEFVIEATLLKVVLGSGRMRLQSVSK